MILRRLWPLLFWAAVAFSFVMAVLPHPPHLPGEPDDKVQHVIAFATLGLFAAAAYPRTSRWHQLIGLSAYGAIIEAVQVIPVLHRDSDIMDWVADTIAAGVVLLVVVVIRRFRSKP